MAKKNNKTEQVLKLITKDEETIEKLAEREPDPPALKSVSPTGQEEVPEPERPAEASPEPVSISEGPSPDPDAGSDSNPPSDPPLESARDPAPEPEPDPVPAPEPEAGADAKPSSEPLKKTERRRLDPKEPLLNLSEVLVRDKAPEVMEKMRVCSCPLCYNDVLALALNNLPTKYVTTDEGKQFLRLEMYKKQYETDVLAALTRACVRVKAAPRH